MPYITTSDQVQLYYEEAGVGEPIVFVHEFGGDMRSWEPQMRYFSRRYRCIAFNARGYAPSDVPDNLDLYSQRRAALDVVEVLDGLEITKAHIVGLSMGGFATVHVGLIAPERARSLVVAGAGYGAEKEHEEHFRNVSLEVAAQFEKQGAEQFSKTYALAASRIAFQLKDPRGWTEFAEHLSQHSALGATMTMRGVQARRPSLYDLENELKAMTVPTLILVGDEDDHCLQPGIFMKRVIPASGLAVLPKAGHTLNLEDPALFNQLVAEFLSSVAQQRWLRRDSRAQVSQIMKVS